MEVFVLYYFVHLYPATFLQYAEIVAIWGQAIHRCSQLPRPTAIVVQSSSSCSVNPNSEYKMWCLEKCWQRTREAWKYRSPQPSNGGGDAVLNSSELVLDLQHKTRPIRVVGLFSLSGYIQALNIINTITYGLKQQA